MKNIHQIEYIKKHPLLILIIIYFFTRLLLLKSLPIFNDEATYIDWGWRMINLKGEFFHSVAHYKPPLFMWIVGLLRKIVSEPLVAGRVVSIFAGALSLLGIYKLGELLYNRKVAFFSALLYIITPIFLFFDRQALMESSVTASGIWSLYFFLKLLKTQDYKYSSLLGLSLGLGYLVKTNAILFAIPLFLLLILQFKDKESDKNTLITNTFILIAALVLTLSPLLLNSLFWKTLGKNKDYIFTFSELLNFPLTQWFGNLKNFFIISILYLGPLLFVLSVTSFYQSIKKNNINIIYSIIYLLTSWLFIIMLSRSVIPRHVVSFLPLVLIFASDSILHLYNKTKLGALMMLTVVIVPFITFSMLLITSPLKYFNTLDKISHFSLKAEYVTYWSSGYGVEEVVTYLKDEATTIAIIAGVRLDAGNPENAIIAYFQESKNVIPTYLDARMFDKFETFDCINSKIPAYFVSRDNQLAGLDKHLEEIKKVYKPENKHYIGIYKVKTDCTGVRILNLF